MTADRAHTMNKAAFLDRDGVINIDHGYLYRPEDFEFTNGIFEACQHLQRKGYLLVVVTNQSGIARGLYSEADFRELTRWMLQRFQEQGVEIAAVYHCPHHPEYTGACTCRKPAPGMLLRAIKELRIDPAASLMLGDKESDMQAAAAAGVGRRIRLSAARESTDSIQGGSSETWACLQEALIATERIQK